MAINPITSAAVRQAASAAPKAPAQAATQQVGQFFNDALDSLSQSQNASDALIQKLAAGENVDLHQVMIAQAETDIRFRVTMAMRDKLVEAYHEVMRMQV